MMRSWIRNHYPHLLLAASSAACLAIVLFAPNHGHRPGYAWPDREQADRLSRDGDTASTNPLKARSLAEILRQARGRLELSQKDQPEVQIESKDLQTLRAAGEDASQHRMIRHRDMASLPKDPGPFAGHAPEYAVVPDPLAWHRPDALPVREYVILGFGEVDQEQTEESTSDINTLAQVPTATGPVDAFAVTGNPDSPGADLTTPALTTPNAGPITELNATETGTQIAPVTAASRSVSQPAAALPITRAEPTLMSIKPDAESDLTRPGRLVKAEPRPTLIQRPTPTTTRTATPVKDETPAIDNIKPSGFIPERKDDPVPVKTPDKQDPRPQSHPDVTDKPVRTLATSKPPAEPSPQTDKPQTGHYQTFPATPAAPKQVVSAKPIRNETDDAVIQTPAASKEKPTNPLFVLVEDQDKIGSGRLNAIDHALTRINQAAKNADLGIELKTTTDKSDGYNILFREDDGKDMGNKLGLAQFAVTEDSLGNEVFLGEDSQASGGKAEITINNAFNWFAGKDENQINDDEYDYQTAVEHELLHLVGLDDNANDLEAVSHGLLRPGEIRRDIDHHEIEDLADLYASANPWRSLSDNNDRFEKDRRGKTRYKSKALTAAVPEPVSAALIGLGVLMGVVRRRR